MQKSTILILIVFIVIIVLPVMIIKGFWFFGGEDEGDKLIINVYHHQQNKIIPMELSAYLKGVIAAEMPARYHIEALKAQAVAARTYTLKQLPAYGGKGSDRHPDADISTDYRYHQAWLSEEEMKERWGFLPFFYFWLKISRAVDETAEEVLVYDNKIIDAVYHSNSGGKTEDAASVWGEKTPYLVSVSSPYDQENERNYKHIHRFTIKEIDDRLDTDISRELNQQTNPSQKILTAPPESDIFKIKKISKGGSILQINIAGKDFTGQEIREKLRLSSCKFEFSLEKNEVICTVLGNGHGVGMSQDGANGYANYGYNYREILTHYYQGTDIINFHNLIQ